MASNLFCAWELVGSTLLIVHRSGATPPESDFLDFTLTASEIPATGYLIVPNDAELSSKQRTAIRHWLSKRKVPASILTDSSMMRGIVTALGWFGVNAAAFPENRLDDALLYLGIPRHEMENVKVALEKLKAMASEHPTAVDGRDAMHSR